MGTPATKQPFDESSIATVEHLILRDQAVAALEVLAAREPPDPRTAFDFEMMSSQAQERLGDYARARAHLVRVLRLSSRCPGRRAHARAVLADVLLRLGQLEQAERQVRRGLEDVHAGKSETNEEPWLLSALARIHRRRGMLRFAIHTLETALAVVERERLPRATRLAISSNLALMLMNHGEEARARSIVLGLQAEDSARLDRRAAVYSQLTAVFFALHVGDVEAAESAFAHVSAAFDGSDLRARLLLDEYGSQILIARGRAGDALQILGEIMDEALDKAPLGDLVPELARWQATALLHCGRFEEALERAQFAARTGRHADVLEWAAGLRVAGQCHMALGRVEQAQTAFAEALSVLQGTDFVAERRRLDAAVEASGLPPLESRAGTERAALRGRTSSASRTGPFRIELRDGRAFVTHDRELVARIQQACSHRLPVLLEGETGTGKELVAHLLHERGTAPEAPFVVVDCTTLPESLAEGELFGAARGAYTGAVSDRRGLVATAHGGTLFFDEVPDLPHAVQSKLLRLLQEGTYRRLGEERPRLVSARIVTATNRDAQQMVADGLLRADLFFRLNGQRLRLRPLRERPEDIGVLAEEFARGAGLAGVADTAVARLQAVSWPGNIRQLEMVIQLAASSRGKGALLDVSLLDSVELESGPASVFPTNLHAERIEAERRILREALRHHRGNITAIARAFGMSRQGLYKALRRTGLL